MSNPSQQWIIESFQVMTPEKVGELTNSVVQRKALPMAAGAEGQEFFEELAVPDEQYSVEEDQDAKIIPLRARGPSTQTKIKEENIIEDMQEDIDLEEKILKELNQEDLDMLQRGSRLESLGIINSDKQRLLDDINKKKKKAKEESPTVFVLNEREKLKDSSVKLATQDAIKSYKKSSTQDSKQKYDEEGKSIVGSSGILVNKKHF